MILYLQIWHFVDAKGVNLIHRLIFASVTNSSLSLYLDHYDSLLDGILSSTDWL